MTKRRLTVPLLLLLAVTSAGQQHRSDPLTGPEIDKVRDAAQMPEIRLKLYVEFVRVRLDKLQQAHSDTKAPDHQQQMRNALQDFLDVYDELGVNVDTFADRGTDIRKALKPVIEGDTEFGSKLRAFKSSLAGQSDEEKSYSFLLSTALEAVDAGAKDHRELLAEQEETFKHKKKPEHKEAAQHAE